MTDTIFREAIPEEPVSQVETPLVELKSDDVQGAKKASDPSDEPKAPVNSLENWELEHGKYGAEILGIKDIMFEFPYRMQFGTMDKYIKGEIVERGWEPNLKHYQEILEELENETGTSET